MKITCNQAMRDLLFQHNRMDKDIYPASKYEDLDVFENQVLQEIEEDGINYLEPVINVNKVKTKTYSYTPDHETVYINSIRIDLFYLWDVSILSFLIYGISIWSVWLWTLKREYPEDTFITSIQFDKWDKEDEISPWFYVKCFHKRDFIGWYGSDIERLKLPYLIIEAPAEENTKKNQYTCICCGFRVFSYAFSHWYNCPVCGWNDMYTSSFIEYHDDSDEDFEDILNFINSQETILQDIPYDTKEYKKWWKLYKRNFLWMPIDKKNLNKKYAYFPKWKFEEIKKEIIDNEWYDIIMKEVKRFERLFKKAQKYNPDEKVHKK